MINLRPSKQPTRQFFGLFFHRMIVDDHTKYSKEGISENCYIFWEKVASPLKFWFFPTFFSHFNSWQKMLLWRVARKILNVGCARKKLLFDWLVTRNTGWWHVFMPMVLNYIWYVSAAYAKKNLTWPTLVKMFNISRPRLKLSSQEIWSNNMRFYYKI